MKRLALGCLILLSLAGCSGTKEVDPDLGKEGETLYLTGGKTVVLVCMADAFDETLLTRQNLESIEDVRQGRVWLVPVGTPVKVVRVQKGERNLRVVQVQEGQYKSKEGSVSYKWLTPEKPKPGG